MGKRDCIYGSCSGCEYENSIDDEGICWMYDPEGNYDDNDEDDEEEDDEDQITKKTSAACTADVFSIFFIFFFKNKDFYKH